MKDFNIYKKRDGQNYESFGSIYASSFEEAKKEFAKHCYNDLLNGVHGDNYLALSVEEDGVEEDGIYHYDELVFPVSNLETGVDYFREDVYLYELRKID